MPCVVEICVDSVNSARQAMLGGANRIELCSNLGQGGTTPTIGLTNCVIDIIKGTNVEVWVMVRPREGDFLYTPDEIQVMHSDIITLKELPIHGFVTGVLTTAGRVDSEAIRGIVAVAHPIPVAMHRAIDMSDDLQRALCECITLGVCRVLTSGGHRTADEGVDVIRRLVEVAGDRLTVMAGCGVTPDNVGHICHQSGVREVHLSAKVPQCSNMMYRNTNCLMGRDSDEYTTYTVSRDVVERVVRAVADL